MNKTNYVPLSFGNVWSTGGEETCTSMTHLRIRKNRYKNENNGERKYQYIENNNLGVEVCE